MSRGRGTLPTSSISGRHAVDTGRPVTPLGRQANGLGGSSLLLDRVQVRLSGEPDLTVATCHEHLTLSERHAAKERRQLRPEGHDQIECQIGWWGAESGAPARPGAETLIQAISGLMSVHGRDRGVPRRLGLDVASTVAGIVAAQAVLAALIGRRRGLPIRHVETSVLGSSLLLLAHHLAIATCGDILPPLVRHDAAGPPFRTADDHWFEIEALSPQAWTAFWTALEADRAAATGSWLSFVYRYISATCTLPSALHEAARRHTLAQIRRAAQAADVALAPLRTYRDLLDSLGHSAPDGGSPGSVAPPGGSPWTMSCQGEPGARKAARPADLVAPLTGLRVVEVTSRLQGPLAGLLLGMLGAHVVKVEPPGGDFGRFSPPLAGSVGAAYLAYNRGKRTIELDYKRPAGRAKLISLVADADVFVQNWPLGRAERLGLDAETLARVNPRLVYAHASGWGPAGDGPSAIAGDFLVQAHAGCGDGLNPYDEPPAPSRVAFVDATGGLVAAQGILAGLWTRELTGHGYRVDSSLMAGAMTLQAQVLRAMVAGHEAGRRQGRPIWSPLDGPLPTADGFLVIAAQDERTYAQLLACCDLGASHDRREAEQLVAERLLTQSTAFWAALCRDAGIPAAAVTMDLADLPRDPLTAAHLERTEGDCWAPDAPWRFSR